MKNIILLLIILIPSQLRAQPASNLDLGMFMPIPINYTNKDYLDYTSNMLDSMLIALPMIKKVGVFFYMENTDTSDWKAVLDVFHAKGLQAIVGFVDSVRQDTLFGGDTLRAGSDLPFRPHFVNGSWQFRDVGTFVSTPSIIQHPALYAIASMDEPWHAAKYPLYKTSHLHSMYRALKNLAPPGTDFKILISFSRMIFTRHYHGDGLGGLGNNPEVFYRDSLCDVVQISTLEFQAGTFQTGILDSNHYTSRKIINFYTPNIELLTTMQTFGNAYGPGTSVQYWFPTPVYLRAALDTVISSRYQDEHPLNTINFQMWDSKNSLFRNNQITLGDKYIPGSPPLHITASQEGIAEINDWWYGATTSAGKLLTSEEFILEQNFPNPFNLGTLISFVLPSTSEQHFVSVNVFDMTGRKVRELFKGSKEAGSHKLMFNGNELSSGVYFYVVETAPADNPTGWNKKTGKMILLK